MQARRTIEHGPDAGWSSVAVTIAPAGAGKDGFYLTLFPDARPPSVVFLRPQQLQQLVDLAGQAAVSDQQIWDTVAKIPMEPLLPSRSLYPRLRALLVDAAGPIRAQVRLQLERQPPPSPPLPSTIAPPSEPRAVAEHEAAPVDPGANDPDDDGPDFT